MGSLREEAVAMCPTHIAQEPWKITGKADWMIQRAPHSFPCLKDKNLPVCLPGWGITLFIFKAECYWNTRSVKELGAVLSISFSLKVYPVCYFVLLGGKRNLQNQSLNQQEIRYIYLGFHQLIKTNPEQCLELAMPHTDMWSWLLGELKWNEFEFV